MNEMVEAAKAFADPTRVRILAALRRGELCVCELSDALGVTQSTLSTHLQVIRDAGLVQTRRDGKWIYYAVRAEADQLLESLFGFFAKTVKNDPAIRRDKEQLAARLKERKGGACCVGFCRPSDKSLK
jgi:ArsR family transcriptional regulator, arsenate/arsenite/antimonite-responsive transcriptional repressor